MLLIGGAAQNVAVQTVLREMVDMPVGVPAIDGYVRRGAGMQAAAAALGAFPEWPSELAELPAMQLAPQIARQHSEAKLALGY
ncbi:hypothetical protein [Lacisediminihabitans profunda]|uniref:Carbohydrate kinase FGGY C-terminal domain-containing protein n=1 Tax=Lacisediminihabitans profunda TaxID=2594790 RepID=A0A5C8UKK3_9MICO|nr:hypothetical protein [Lacisediminihabitans profunda]TXN28347.1 hypothetical protein FVP33_17935 [Lacisediminihabitans profunda]